MAPRSFLALIGLAISLFSGASAQSSPSGLIPYPVVCSTVSALMTDPDSMIHYPGSPVYDWLLKHWIATSTQQSACVVEPATPADVGKVLITVGLTRTPFAVKSGGHVNNPGFSSTLGVHISLNKFRSINYDPVSQTVEFGTGLKFEEINAAIETHGVIVLGGRQTSIGVGGFTLNGGYSYKTNQHGLALDTVTAFELVKPNGAVITVTETSDPQLFMGLKGSGNNFGVVTKITMKAFTQGNVWGGSVSYDTTSSITALAAATADFTATVTDPKASMLTIYSYLGGQPRASASLFYDGPTPPTGIFDDFLSIPHVSNNVATRTYNAFITATSGNFTNQRLYLDTIPVPNEAYTHDFVSLVQSLAASKGAELAPQSMTLMMLIVEPFLPEHLSHGGPSAFPFTRTKSYTPFGISFGWTDPTKDAIFKQAVKDVRDALTAHLVANGHPDVETAPMYPNYSLWDTPLSRIFGSRLPSLKLLKLRIDPLNVMGLAGGFKIKLW